MKEQKTKKLPFIPFPVAGGVRTRASGGGRSVLPADTRFMLDTDVGKTYIVQNRDRLA